MTNLQQELDPNIQGDEAARLREYLLKNIVGQPEAIDEILNIYEVFLAGMTMPEHPIANILFLGPTGSGKTYFVETLAEAILGRKNSVLKIDCAEFQHGHEIAKLVGSPPGYLGHRETRPLITQEILDKHHTDNLKISFVLFDEIEKADNALWDLLLGIMDKATLTTGDNRRVDFSKSIIFMTSNLGSKEMSNILNPGFGFRRPFNLVSEDSVRNNQKLSNQLKRSGIAAAQRKFTPEFINRLDKIVVFQALGLNELRQILELELNALQNRILAKNNKGVFLFRLTRNAKDFLLVNGTDLKYGARPLKRTIERHLVVALSKLMTSKQVGEGDIVEIDYSSLEKKFVFKRIAEGVPVDKIFNNLNLKKSETNNPKNQKSTTRSKT